MYKNLKKHSWHFKSRTKTKKFRLHTKSIIENNRRLTWEKEVAGFMAKPQIFVLLKNVKVYGLYVKC